MKGEQGDQALCLKFGWKNLSKPYSSGSFDVFFTSNFSAETMLTFQLLENSIVKELKSSMLLVIQKRFRQIR
jgi:hypothetical protein